jgi:Fe-Mn family superoxide dismutase
MPDKKSDYALPELPYAYNALVPHISEEQLRIHHDKHHAAYVKGANDILEKLEKSRKEGTEIDMKSALKSLSFNIGGHILHSIFWTNMAPKSGGEPKGKLLEAIKKDFGSFNQFKKEFTAAAMNIEGSGWAALVKDAKSGRLIIMQIEKHNQNMYPDANILLVLDMWEHAFYIDYKNEKGKFVEAFWNVVNWHEAGKRLA